MRFFLDYNYIYNTDKGNQFKIIAARKGEGVGTKEETYRLKTKTKLFPDRDLWIKIDFLVIIILYLNR